MTTIANGASAKSKGPTKQDAGLRPAKKEAVAEEPSMAPTTDIVKLGGGKPDLNHHHSQLDLIKANIDKTTAELVSHGLRWEIAAGHELKPKGRTACEPSFRARRLPTRPRAKGGQS